MTETRPVLRRGWPADEVLASLALALMALIPLVEMVCRPLLGQGVQNAPVLVQHLGLVMAMWGALAAERHGHLTRLSVGGVHAIGHATAALLCGVLAWASWQFVHSEIEVGQVLAYGMPVWWLQVTMPVGFACLSIQFAWQCSTSPVRWVWAVGLPALAVWAASVAEGVNLSVWPMVAALLLALGLGAPIFAVLGGVALVLFWQEGLPLASMALSHYQITVNPSLPALPLFTLAGLVFARTGAAQRLGQVFTALFGGGVRGTVFAATVLCSCFTAFTGGSGVTILALGGLLLPLLREAGYPEQRGISLVTSASALGVLLAPSVPLIMYAIIARVPINTMFLAGLVPAGVMVLCLLYFGGYVRRDVLAQAHPTAPNADVVQEAVSQDTPRWVQRLGAAVWHAKWEVLAPVVTLGSLVGGLATPTESAALTAIYAVVTQAWWHKELSARELARCLSYCAQVIGGVMLILGMALGLTNFLIDAGIPDLAIDAVQGLTANKYVFLLLLNVGLFAAGALMEIYAAIVVLVPLLLPLAVSYGIDPVHFGIIFLANMEMGFLCPPAGMNIYFASAVFGRPIRQVAKSVLPAVLAIFVGTLLISWLPLLATGLPELFKQMGR